MAMDYATTSSLGRIQLYVGWFSGWALSQHYESRVKLRVTFANSKPSITELIALRKLLPGPYSNMQPAEFRAMVGTSGLFEMGSFDGTEGKNLWFRAKDLGLFVERNDILLTVTGFLDRTNNMMMLIEDGNLASQIAGKMIVHGRPMIIVEVD